MVDYATARLDEIEELLDSGARYRPIRHRLGITSFGVTAWTARAAGEVIINEHDDGDPSADEELFVVVRGHAVFEVDGDRVEAPAGTLVFLPPRAERTATAAVGDTVVLAIEGTPGRAYEARGWELWAPLAPLYFAGGYSDVADRLGQIVRVNDQYPMLFFNLACAESRCGRTKEAIGHLRRAVAMSRELRDAALTDADLDPIRDEPEFSELIVSTG